MSKTNFSRHNKIGEHGPRMPPWLWACL